MRRRSGHLATDTQWFALTPIWKPTRGTRNDAKGRGRRVGGSRLSSRRSDVHSRRLLRFAPSQTASPRFHASRRVNLMLLSKPPPHAPETLKEAQETGLKIEANFWKSAADQAGNISRSTHAMVERRRGDDGGTRRVDQPFDVSSRRTCVRWGRRLSQLAPSPNLPAFQDDVCEKRAPKRNASFADAACPGNQPLLTRAAAV